MGRLIDADRLKAHYCWWAGGSKEMSIDEAKKTFDTIIDVHPTVDIDAITETHEKIGYDKGYRDGYAQATVDAVEVVRCKDCKWWKTKNMRNGERKVCVIEAFEPVRNEDEYCSWAERREDATD